MGAIFAIRKEAKSALRRAFSFFMAIVLVSGCVFPTQAVADNTFDSKTSMLSSSAESDTSETDITEAWNAGALEITEAGRYVLSGNVETSGTLSINVAAGQEVVIDFCGYSVVVTDGVDAGIDVSSSRGDVSIIDSTYDAGDDADNPVTPSASLTVVGTKMDGPVCGIVAQWAQAEDEEDDTPSLNVSGISINATLSTVDASVDDATLEAYGVYAGIADAQEGDTVDVVLENCSVSAYVQTVQSTDLDSQISTDNSDEYIASPDEVGAACAVFAAVPGVSLSGYFWSEAASEGGACDLYAVSAESFVLEESFTPCNTLSVYSAGNEAGEAFALVADEPSFDAEVFEDASGQGLTCVFNDGLALFKENESVQADTESEESDSSDVTSDDDSDEQSEGSSNSADATTDSGEVAESDEEETSDETEDSNEANLSNLFVKAIASTRFSPATVLNMVAATLAEDEDENICLNDLVANDSSSYLQLEADKTYYLSADLEYGNSIYFDNYSESSGSITLDLRGYTLTLHNSITVGQSSNSTNEYELIVCSTSNEKGQIHFEDGGYLEVYTNGKLELNNVSIKKTYTTSSGITNSGYTTYATAVYVHSNTSITTDSYRFQTVRIVNSSIEADYSNQTSNPRNSSENEATALRVDSRALRSLEIVNSTIQCIGPTANVYYVSGSTTYYVSASALYLQARLSNSSVTPGEVAIEGSTFEASSGYGSAYGIYSASSNNTSLTFSGSEQTAFSVNGGNASYGVYLASAGTYTTLTVALNAPLVFTSASNSGTVAALAYIYSSYTGGAATPFRVGSGFSGENLPVLIGTAASSANKAGNYFATWADDFEPDSDTQSTIAASFTSASKGAIVLAADESGLYFDVDTENSYAYIGDDDDRTYYSTVEEAFSDAQSGDTVVLTKDLDSLTLASDSESATDTYTVDLDGHSVGILENQSSAQVTVKNGTIKGSLTSASGSSSRMGVYQNGTGTLTLSDVKVSVSSSATSVYGIYVNSGSVVLSDGATVSAWTNTGMAYGVYVSSGNISTDEGTTVEVSQYGTEYAYGIYAHASNIYEKSIAIAGSVTATGIGSTTVAVYVGNNTALKASGELAAHAASGTSEGSSIYALQAVSGATSVSLDGASLTTSVDSDVSGQTEICVDLASSDVSLALKGSCSFKSSESGVHLSLSTSLQLDTNFSLAEDSDSTLTVESDQLTDDVLANLVDSSSASVSLSSNEDSLTSLFSAAEGSFYADEGWELNVSGGTQLVWERDSVACITTDDTTTYYSTLSAAISTASDGDIIRITKDTSESAVSVGKSLTIDLNGHTVTLKRAASSILSTKSALTLTGGTLTVTDSSTNEKGSLVLSSGPGYSSAVSLVVVGLKTLDTSRAYSGVSISNEATLVLDGSTVEVSYNRQGVSSTTDSSGIVGAYVNDGGTLQLQNDASLSVSSAPTDSLISGGGAALAYGVLSGGSSASVSLDATSAIAVNNYSSFVEEGSTVSTIGSTSSSNTVSTSLNSANVTKLSLDEDSELYQEIAAKFKEVAQYDSASSRYQEVTVSSVYGAGIYYAAPLQLDDGTAYWVFSDPVENVGDVSEITPDHIYVQSSYQISPDAVGISGAGTVSVSGSVSVTSSKGNAYAVQTSGTLDIDGASLSAITQGTSSYRGLSSTAPNLTEEIGLSSSLGVKFYPSNSSINEVLEMWPEAVAIAASSSSASITLDGEVSLVAQADGSEQCEAIDILADSFTIGSSLSLSDESDDPLSVADSSGESAAGATFAVAEDGVTLTTELRDLFSDATGTYTAIISDNSLVWNGTYTVRFIGLGGSLVQEEEDVANGQTVILPSAEIMAYDDGSASVYEFVGWSTDADATADDDSVFGFDGDGNYLGYITFSAPDGADEVVNYYAVYRETTQTVTVSFAAAFDRDGNAIATESVDIEVGSTLREAVGEHKLDMSASTYTDEDSGSRYVFIGWKTSTLESNTSATYDAQSIMDTPIYNDVRFTAVYVVADSDQYVACFKVDNKLYAAAFEKGTSPIWSEAYGSAGMPSTFTEDGVSYSFAGWAKGYKDDYVRSDDNPVTVANSASLPVSSDDVYYTALFDGTLTQVTLTFNYWRQDSSDTWVFSSSSVSCDYGSDPFALVDAQNFTQDGCTYTFLGWSTRYNDILPMWGEGGTLGAADDMPTATGSATYWAIYEVEEQTTNVTFIVNGEQYATASGLPVSTSISDAFAAALDSEGNAVSEPSSADESLEFDGWNANSNAEDGLSSFATLQTYLDEEGNVTLYAIWVSALEIAVTLYDNDGVDDDEPYYETYAYLNGQVQLSESFVNPNKAGMYLAGWNTKADGSGEDFDILSDAVTSKETLSLYAQYEPIQVDATEAEDVSAELEGAYVNASAAMGSQGVVLEIVQTETADANLVTQDSSESTLASYTVRLGFVKDDLTTYVTSGFGTIKLNFPISSDVDEDDISIYWLDENGSQRTSSSSTLEVSKNSDGTHTATLSISGWALTASGGNVLIVAEDDTSSSSGTTGATDSGSSSGNKTSSSSSGSSSSGTSSSGSSSSGSTGSSGSTSSSGLSSSGSSLSSSSGLSSSSSGLSSSSSGLSSSSGSDSSTGLSSSTSSDPQELLGFSLEEVTSDLVSEYGLSVDSGLYVSAVEEGSAAEDAGIQVGDVITAIDGVSVSSLEELEEALADKQAGDEVTLTIDRDGETVEVTLTIPEDATTLSALTTTGDDSLASAEEEAESSGVLQWIQNHLVLVCVLGLILLAALSALVWWLLRRRNRAYVDEEDEGFQEDDDSGVITQGSATPAIQF